jgi:hypothetical protein
MNEDEPRPDRKSRDERPSHIIIDSRRTGGAILPKYFSKELQLLQRSNLFKEARAEVIFGGAG